MLKLKKVKINKYKSFSNEQTVSIEKNITILVGKNESGKTCFLEAIAKSNYFDKNDDKFKFDVTLDFPRKELVDFQRLNEDIEVIRCTYEIGEQLLEKINNELGKGVLQVKEFSYEMRYKTNGTWYEFETDEKKFLTTVLKNYEIDKELSTELKKIQSLEAFVSYYEGLSEKPEILTKVCTDLKNKIINKAYPWNNLIAGYIAKNFLEPSLPKFWYFDDYYSLPSRINFNKLSDNQLDEEELKISKALVELSGIDIKNLLSSNDFEQFIAQLEATSNNITDKIFQYWTTNKNLEIDFKIDTTESNEKILDIRVKNTKHRVTLPLEIEVKVFNGFFLFLFGSAGYRVKIKIIYYYLMSQV